MQAREAAVYQTLEENELMVMVFILIILSSYGLGELNLRHCDTNIPEL